MHQVDAAGICWVPVRHHSPAASRAVRDLIARLHPVAVLIEGPSDYDRIDQLLLPHEPPISLMTWLRLDLADRPGRPLVAHAVYPFTVFSPEWQAVVRGAAAGADVRFIDLPWAQQFLLERTERNAPTGPGEDEAAALQRTDAVSETFFDRLAGHTGRREMSAVWDELAEVDPALDTSTYLQRAALLGAGIRADSDAAGRGGVGGIDVPREAHMAAEIRRARADHPDGVLLVITGAAHTAALIDRLATAPRPDELATQGGGPVALPEALDTGHALLPASYADLDEQRGYLAGQPSPGFYDRVFAAGDPSGAAEVVDTLLVESLATLRAAKAGISAADAIAARTTMIGLATLRGHARPWRDDLVDALTSTLVKDTVAADAVRSADGGHPLINRVRELMRGDVVGRLAAGTDHPPLVVEVETACAARGMPLGPGPVAHRLDLDEPADRERAHLLHRLRVLGIPAARLTKDARPSGSGGGPVGARVSERPDATQEWEVRGGVAVTSASVLASRYGPTVERATLAVLARRAETSDLGELTVVLLDAVLCGLPDLSGRLSDRVIAATLETDRLPALAGGSDAPAPLPLLLRLHRFDRWYGVTGRADLGELLHAVALRCVEVIERLPPQPAGTAARTFALALRRLTDAVVASPVLGDLETRLRAAIAGQASRGAIRGSHAPEVDGALMGALWLIESVLPSASAAAGAGPAGAPDPAGTGEWYAGLLAVAGHLALAAPEIFDPLDEALREWSDEEFVLALPDLRRAGTALQPRERSALLDHLTGERTGTAPLVVAPELLPGLLARESALWARVESHTGPLRVES